MAAATLEVLITANIASLQSALKQATGDFKEFTKTNSEAIKTIGTAATAMGAALTAATTVGIKSFGDFQKSIAGVRQQLNAAGRGGELDAFAKGIRDVGANTGKSFEELGAGLENLLDAGLAAGNEIEALEQISKFAIGTNTEFAGALDVVQRSMLAFGKEAGSVDEVTDKLLKTTLAGVIDLQGFNGILGRLGATAAGAGVGFDEFAGAIAFLSTKGVDARSTQAVLLEVIEAVTNQTSEQAKKLREAGVAIDEKTLKEKGLIGVIQQINALNPELLNGIFSTAKAREAAALFTAHEADALKALNDVKQSAGAVDDEFVERQKDLDQQLQQLQRSFQALVLEAIEPLIPHVIGLVEKITQAVKGVREWAAEHPELARMIVLVGAVLGPLLIALGGLILLLPQIASGLTSASAAFTAITSTTGLWVIGIGAAVLAVGTLVAAVLELKSAQDRLKEAQESASFPARQQIDLLEKLRGNAKTLTETEKQRIATLQQELGVVGEQLVLLTKKQAFDTEEFRLARERLIQLRAESLEIQKNVEEREKQVKVNDILAKSNGVITDDIIKQIKALEGNTDAMIKNVNTQIEAAKKKDDLTKATEKATEATKKEESARESVVDKIRREITETERLTTAKEQAESASRRAVISGGGGGGGATTGGFGVEGGVRVFQSLQDLLNAPFSPGAVSRVRSFQHGTDFVPETGLALLHKGEAVVPAGRNNGGGDITVVNLFDPALVPSLLAQYPNAVLNIVNADILSNGPTRKVIRSVGR